ncbi:hypothetical protein BGW38_003305 [Lunasporangiospora selenospora]|uniref:F-box domain-containing protein n=1 Tax=Lunasporangiospora selenospora TaxID=979761 RepID=A0A9P6FSV8_9FUNG|nr:hypothetical protein BGW38_003305 [Lunasporangiospora selenospora]
MVTVNDDVVLAVLVHCDIYTVVKCRAVSKRFKHVIDKELVLEKADFSALTFRQRRNVTDSVMTPAFTHIFRRASIICLDGTGISHYGVMKIVTNYTKDLHVERCPRVDLGRLIQAIAGYRWLTYDLDPVCLYTKNREARGMHDYDTITKPLREYNWAVVMMSNDCRCRYVKIEEYQGEYDIVPCHACDKDVTTDVTCSDCGHVTCTECQAKVCGMSKYDARFCKGCATEARCSVCHNEWCGRCNDVRVFQCYGCEASICSECQPLRLRCSVEEYRQYCAQCTSAMADKDIHWCCDAGEFSMEPAV